MKINRASQILVINVHTYVVIVNDGKGDESKIKDHPQIGLYKMKAFIFRYNRPAVKLEIEMIEN